MRSTTPDRTAIRALILAAVLVAWAPSAAPQADEDPGTLVVFVEGSRKSATRFTMPLHGATATDDSAVEFPLELEIDELASRALKKNQQPLASGTLAPGYWGHWPPGIGDTGPRIRGEIVAGKPRTFHGVVVRARLAPPPPRCGTPRPPRRCRTRR